MHRTVAAIGDVADPHCWSGIPFHFWRAGSAVGFVTDPWRTNLARFTWSRRSWNLRQILQGRAPGGFQYSEIFLRAAEKQIPKSFFASEIITFNQHFPRACAVREAGGRLNHYVDAPFAALTSGRGLALKLPASVVIESASLERENYSASERVITMARWAAEAIVHECRVPCSKVFTILPGAGLELPADWNYGHPAKRAGKERDFVLGFVGKDWERKGLMFLVEVRDELVRRGWRSIVRCAGHAPMSLARRKGVEFVGFIDKHRQSDRFAGFLADCDLGCLFSRREALGISTLEFLRAGVPVAGFAHEGPDDTLPPDAGFRFALSATPTDVADILVCYLDSHEMQVSFRRNANRWSTLVTWERCLREMQELWETGTIRNPIQPWLGLPRSNE